VNKFAIAIMLWGVLEIGGKLAYLSTKNYPRVLKITTGEEIVGIVIWVVVSITAYFNI
jgi:hypothetical protein